jgi:hypothetical protein
MTNKGSVCLVSRISMRDKPEFEFVSSRATQIDAVSLEPVT